LEGKKKGVKEEKKLFGQPHAVQLFMGRRKQKLKKGVFWTLKIRVSFFSVYLGGRHTQQCPGSRTKKKTAYGKL
jgi:hypothetical protein